MVFGKNIRVNHGGIAGRSWFAGEDIKAGELIWWPDEELNEKYTADYPADWVLSTWSEEKQGIAYEVSPGVMNAPRIDLDWEKDIPKELMEDFYINHSCNASVWFHATENKFLARRDIKEGEEITYDYGTTECNPKWGMDCLCGLPCCRGRITGDDWKNAEFRERFKGHFFGGVQKKIAEFEKQEAEEREKKAVKEEPATVSQPEAIVCKGKRKTSCDSNCDKKVNEKKKGRKPNAVVPKDQMPREMEVAH
jgi:hypothetical protein